MRGRGRGRSKSQNSPVPNPGQGSGDSPEKWSHDRYSPEPEFWKDSADEPEWSAGLLPQLRGSPNPETASQRPPQEVSRPSGMPSPQQSPNLESGPWRRGPEETRRLGFLHDRRSPLTTEEQVPSHPASESNMPAKDLSTPPTRTRNLGRARNRRPDVQVYVPRARRQQMSGVSPSPGNASGISQPHRQRRKDEDNFVDTDRSSATEGNRPGLDSVQERARPVDTTQKPDFPSERMALDDHRNQDAKVDGLGPHPLHSSFDHNSKTLPANQNFPMGMAANRKDTENDNTELTDNAILDIATESQNVIAIQRKVVKSKASDAEDGSAAMEIDGVRQVAEDVCDKTIHSDQVNFVSQEDKFQTNNHSDKELVQECDVSDHTDKHILEGDITDHSDHIGASIESQETFEVSKNKRYKTSCDSDENTDRTVSDDQICSKESAMEIVTNDTSHEQKDVFDDVVFADESKFDHVQKEVSSDEKKQENRELCEEEEQKLSSVNEDTDTCTDQVIEEQEGPVDTQDDIREVASIGLDQNECVDTEVISQDDDICNFKRASDQRKCFKGLKHTDEKPDAVTGDSNNTDTELTEIKMSDKSHLSHPEGKRFIRTDVITFEDEDDVETNRSTTQSAMGTDWTRDEQHLDKRELAEHGLDTTEEVDGDSWDAMFNDDGECLDPNALEELTKVVGKVKIQKSKNINYLDYQPKVKSNFDFAQYEHIIEIYDFPAEFVTRDLISAFKDFMSKGFDLKWVDDTHALGIFSSAIAAKDALNLIHPLLKVCPLAQASKQSQMKARRCTEFLQPYKPRPETTAAAARRLVAGALGIATGVSKEKREKERQQLKEAKAKKRQDRQNREEIWEYGKCAMDEEP